MDSHVTTREPKKSTAGFLHLPYEIRLMMYRLSLPSASVFDLLEKPTVLGRTYWNDFSPTSLATDPDSDSDSDSEPDSETALREYNERLRADRGAQANAQANAQSGPQDEAEEEPAESDQEENDDDAADDDDDDEDDGDEGDDDGDDEDEWDDWDRDMRARARDWQGVTDDTWPQEVQPSMDRLRSIQGLLLASRLIREEVLDLLYGENVFCVNLLTKADLLERQLSIAKLRRVRHLMLVLLPKGPRNFGIDSDAWDAVLQQLQTLRLVVEQPYASPAHEFKHQNGCLAAEWKRSWLDGFEHVLEQVGSQTPGSTKVLFDIGGLQRFHVLHHLQQLARPQQWVRTKVGRRLGMRLAPRVMELDHRCCFMCDPDSVATWLNLMRWDLGLRRCKGRCVEVDCLRILSSAKISPNV